jgi:hypothetical protein
MSLTELALLDGRRPLPLWDVIGLTLTLTLTDQLDPSHDKKATRFRIITTGKYLLEIVSSSCYEVPDLGSTVPGVLGQSDVTFL